MRMKKQIGLGLLLVASFLFVGLWMWSTVLAVPDNAPKILFVRGGSGTGGFLEGGADEQLSDITNNSTNGGNHGWGTLADILEGEGFVLEQLIEGPAANNTPIDFANMDLSSYSVIVLGSNNAAYPQTAVDAIEAYVRNGGGLLVISDANWGQNWDDAPDSDQPFLDRFGLTMNQDQGTYTLSRNDGDFVLPDHPILSGVDSFDGEGVSPITVGSNLPDGVAAQVVAPAEGQLRQNDADGQGSSRAVTPADGALVVATIDNGRLAGHFDRNTFFNENGAGTSIVRKDNAQYARNLFNWLAGSAVVPPPPLQISGLVLVNADADVDIRPLNNGDTLNLATLPTQNLNVRAEVIGQVGSVRFELDTDSSFAIENAPPYALAGDSNGDYNAWTPTLGQHQLRAVPYPQSNGQGDPGFDKMVSFLVIDDINAPAPTPIPILDEPSFLPLIEK